MSCNYADGLSSYDNKGVLGLAEKFDTDDNIENKTSLLTEWILQSRHVVVHTGAGISTSAGIPDFRGPNGVWTLEKKGMKPITNISFNEAEPTVTHMALTKLVETEHVKFIISQNIDGLHLRSGLPRNTISELHGNIFTEKCNICDRQFVRNTATTSVGQKSLGTSCPGPKHSGRSCRGKLHDTILDWEDNLPAEDLDMAYYHSNMADLNICLGTTLQIVPSGNLPLHSKKYGGRVVIINLQPTKHDAKANLIINMYVDEAMKKVMKKLGLEIPEYQSDKDPTRRAVEADFVEWTLTQKTVKSTQKRYEETCKSSGKKRKLSPNSTAPLDSKLPKKEESSDSKVDVKNEDIEEEEDSEDEDDTSVKNEETDEKSDE
ncbi:Sirtuin 6 [Carabus blaptoides fortunei]